MPYGGYSFDFNDSYTKGYGSLFDRDPFSFKDVGIDEEQLRKAEEEIREANSVQAQKKQKRQDRKERFIEALPYLAAALTSEDSGQLGRALMAFAELKADTKQRRETFAEQRQAREREAQLQREKEESERTYQREMVREEREFRTGERVAGQEFTERMTLKGQLFDLERDDRGFRQDLMKMGYNHELAGELEEIQHRHRVSLQAQGFEHNNEIFRRGVSEELAVRMEQAGIAPDIARSASEQLSFGVPTYQLGLKERTALDLYTKYNKANTEQERARALLSTTLAVMDQEVPIEGARPDPYTGQVPTRRLNPSEIIPFITKDPVSALQSLISPPGPDEVRQFTSSTGESVGTVQNREEYNKGVDTALTPDNLGIMLQTGAKRINSDVQATDFAKELYLNYGLSGSKGMVNTLPIDPKYKGMMVQVLEELDIQAKQREEMLRNMTDPNFSGNFSPLGVPQ